MAKVTVSFVTDDNDNQIKIESDQERNKDYTGKMKTKFRYGDTAYFRVYSSAPDTVQAVSTDGDIRDFGIFSDTVTDEIASFLTENTASMDKPVKSIKSYKWLGNSLGELSVNDPYSVKSAETPSASDGSIAISSISYLTSYRLFGLTLGKRELSEYPPVVVYVSSINV